jgi:CspA family cold shock protein
MQGIIKTLTDKGFGFISTDGQPDVFFHSSALVDVMFDQLRKGDAVTYDVEDSPKGPRAANVRKA